MDIVIVGSGPSAAGVALSMMNRPDVKMTVIDIGGLLEDDRVAARRRLSFLEPDQWDPQDVSAISATPRAQTRGSLPRKQIFASNFPFEDFGQLEGVASADPVNELVVSGAYGGFSNTWGAQIMPYSTGTFRSWPLTRADMEPHYRAILAHIPYAGESDDLEELFPLMGSPSPLPRVAERTKQVLHRYERHRLALRRLGVTAGYARLALNAPPCRLCGLCLTGCPYELIYSASQTFDALRKSGQLQYLSNYRVHTIREDGTGRPTIYATSTNGGTPLEISADRAFIGAGSIGSTRIVANSLGWWNQKLQMEESAQFVIPFLSRRSVKTLTQTGEFTLNQFNILVSLDEDGQNASLVHCYPYNDHMTTAVPSLISNGPLNGLAKMGFRHLTVGLGYLPSWASPKLRLQIGSKPPRDDLPTTSLSWLSNEESASMTREVLSRLNHGGRHLDLHPIPRLTKLSDPAKSYHFGGSLPHSNRPTNEFSTDLLGRVRPWRNTHLIDASVFPTVAATTFTLTIMANAHRIANDAMRTSSP